MLATTSSPDLSLLVLAVTGFFALMVLVFALTVTSRLRGILEAMKDVEWNTRARGVRRPADPTGGAR